MLYKFKSYGKNLIDELENHYIYFSDVNNFNDYGENNINLIFNGDIIAWKGFLRHYISSLYLTTHYGEFEKNSKVCIYIENYYSDKCTYSQKQINYLKKLSLNFLEDKFVKYFLEVIADKKVSQKKLLLIIRLIQWRALLLIYPVDLEFQNELEKIDSFEVFKEFLNKIIETDNIKEINNIALYLDGICITQKVCKLKRNDSITILEFPNEYFQQIKKMIYPNKYITCFTERFDNTAMWGYYSNSFKGICLEFNTNNENGKEYIEFYNRTGIVSKKEKDGTISEKEIFEYEKIYFQKVIYGDNELTFPEINFFDNIGMIPFTYKSLLLCDENFEASKYFRNDDEWRKNYWDLFYYISTHKLLEWKHEKEQRLITDDTFFSFDDEETRKLKYKFESLNGIIFGPKIEKEHKDKIIEIIAKKCKNEGRKEFNFYNLLYINGIIEKQKCLSSILKFNILLNS